MLVLILLLVIPVDCRVVLQLHVVVIVAARPWRRLLLELGCMLDLACDRQAFFYEHLGVLELLILVPIIVMMVLGTALHPCLIHMTLRAEEHSFLLPDHVCLYRDPIFHIRLRVVHRDAELGSPPELLVHDHLKARIFKIAHGFLLDCGVWNQLHPAARLRAVRASIEIEEGIIASAFGEAHVEVRGWDAPGVEGCGEAVHLQISNIGDCNLTTRRQETSLDWYHPAVSLIILNY